MDLSSANEGRRKFAERVRNVERGAKGESLDRADEIDWVKSRCR
jgi:hypothetical protein